MASGILKGQRIAVGSIRGEDQPTDSAVKQGRAVAFLFFFIMEHSFAAMVIMIEKKYLRNQGISLEQTDDPA